MKPAAGVKLSVPSALIVTVPSALVAFVTVSGSPSGSLSLPRTLMLLSVSPARVVYAGAATLPSSVAIGDWLTGGTAGSTCKYTVALAVPPWPSAIV